MPVPEVAELLGMTGATAYRMCRDGESPAVRFAGLVLVRRDQLEAEVGPLGL